MIILGSDQENKLLAKGGNYMELSIQIKKYRTELHLSQEELAEKVYVTRQTISNWENEKSYPDIHSLLLLSSLFNVSLDQLIKGDIEKMKEIISEQEIKKFNYYGSIYTVHLAVLIISAVPLFMWLGRYAYIPFGILFIITMYWALKVEKLKKKNDIQTYKEIVAFTEGKKLDELHKAVEVGKRPYQNILKVNVIVEWLERTAESPNEKVRISSIFMLAAKYIQMEKYKEANIFLDKIPDTVIDATIMKTNVLAHQEGTDIAAFFLEGKLMQTVTNIQNYLYKLIEMEEETGNHCKAEEIAEITEHMVSLFGLWDYGKVVPYLLIAVYRKDVEKCIQLIKEVLMESKKPWKMVESPLYYRYVDTVQGKSFSGVGNNFVHALATEIENKEEYEFLKGNKELEAIFSQYLK